MRNDLDRKTFTPYVQSGYHLHLACRINAQTNNNKLSFFFVDRMVVKPISLHRTDKPMNKRLAFSDPSRRRQQS